MLALHILTVVFSLCVVVLADKEALSWILGWRNLLDAKKVALYHWLTWAGLTTLVLSGAYLALPILGYLLTQPLFIMKLLFVAILLLNAILIGRLSQVATTRTFKELTWDETYPLVTSGAISFVSWTGAFILALVVFR